MEKLEKRKREIKKSIVWGKHLIIDAYGIEARQLRDLSSIRQLLNNLVLHLKMRPLCRATVKKVQSDYYPDWGVSGFIMLYESHISIHTWPEENYAAIDIYSCKYFDEEKALNYLKKFFQIQKIKKRLIIRK